MSVTGFSDERSMAIEKVRMSLIIAFYEVSEISRWISDDHSARSEMNWPIAIATRRRKDRCVGLWQDARSTEGRSRAVMTGKWSDGDKPRVLISEVQTKSDGAVTRFKVCL